MLRHTLCPLPPASVHHLLMRSHPPTPQTSTRACLQGTCLRLAAANLGKLRLALDDFAKGSAPGSEQEAWDRLQDCLARHEAELPAALMHNMQRTRDCLRQMPANATAVQLLLLLGNCCASKGGRHESWGCKDGSAKSSPVMQVRAANQHDAACTAPAASITFRPGSHLHWTPL